MQKFKVNGQSVPKMEWKVETNEQTDGQADGRMKGCDSITSLANVVGKYTVSPVIL